MQLSVAKTYVYDLRVASKLLPLTLTSAHGKSARGGWRAEEVGRAKRLSDRSVLLKHLSEALSTPLYHESADESLFLIASVNGGWTA